MSRLETIWANHRDGLAAVVLGQHVVVAAARSGVSGLREIGSGMAESLARRVLSPILDPIGNTLLMSRLGDLGLAYRHGERSATNKVVALTFDDGPVLGGTEQVLDALAEGQVPGTFFCIGANALLHPEIIRRAVAEGHIIGAHSMNHGRTGAVSPTDTAHIDDCLATLRPILGGKTPLLYRPPWGWLTPWEMRRLRQRGMAVIRWDVETPDSLVPCPPGDYMASWTAPRVQPGTVIVFHDGMTHADRHEKPETARALRLLVPRLKAAGYTFVTIPELFGIPAYREDDATDAAMDMEMPA